MSIRWYSVVVDCRDPAAQARWWAQALDWRIVYEAPDEVVAVPAYALDESRVIPPAEQGPGLIFVPVPEGKDTRVKVGFKLGKGSLADAPTLARRATWSSRTHQMHQRNRTPQTHRLRIRWCIRESARCGR